MSFVLSILAILVLDYKSLFMSGRERMFPHGDSVRVPLNLKLLSSSSHFWLLKSMCQKTETEITILTHFLDYHEDLGYWCIVRAEEVHLDRRCFSVLPCSVTSINGQLQES